MNIPLWLLLAIVCTAGAVGGLVNGLISDNGFLLPCMQEVDHLRIVRPGFLGNTLNGKVVEGWQNGDTLGMLQQLGVVPAPGQSS